MRIAMFSDSYTPIVNGVSVSIQLLIEELRARGHSVHPYTAAYPGYRDDDPNVVRFRSIRTPYTGDYPLAIPPFYQYVRGFRSQAFDLVHTHTPYTVGYVGMRWAESEHLPLVSTYHTLYEKYVHYIPMFPKWYVLYKIWKHTNYYYNQCQQVIAPSEAAKKSLARHYVTKPITVIPTGCKVNRGLDRPEARRAAGVRDNEKLALYVGRIAREKNIGFLLEAAAIAMRQNSALRLIFVGDGPFRARSEAYARALGIGDRTKFVGAVPRESVETFFAAADLFVFASQTETQGLVIGEAMLHGVPAIAVQGGGAAAAVEDNVNGFVVPPDVGMFADAMLRFFSNAALAERLSRGARESSKGWTAATMCDAVLEVYERAVHEYRGGVKTYEYSRAD